METEVEIHVLGPLTVRRHGAEVALPQSRKVRAQLGYLALTAHAVPRSRLSELLWDIAADRRGELRWCLTKLRGVVDTQTLRLLSLADAVRLDLSDTYVDAAEVMTAADFSPELGADRLFEIVPLFRGDFLEGLELPDSPAFSAWLAAQRRAFRDVHIGVLERLAQTATDDAARPYLDEWLRLAPFDDRAHIFLLKSFIRRHDVRAGQQYLAAVISQYAAEGIGSSAISTAWRNAMPTGILGGIVETIRIDAAGPSAQSGAELKRASVAVMPFREEDHTADAPGTSGEAFAHDVITRLAKLRNLFVIAPETVLALSRQSVGSEAAGHLLNIDYVVGGTLRRRAERFVVEAHLTEAATSRLIWSDAFGESSGESENAFAVLDAIGNRIVSTVAGEIEAAERNRAILKPPSSLNAWEAYHCGLWHMYRFNKDDNDCARRFFEQAIRLDRTFSRAFAGLSFTHFQNAFQGWTIRQPEADRAFEVAGQGLMADDRDPSAHWAMGRALWLGADVDGAVGALGQSVELSPNFALAHYTLAFVHGRPAIRKRQSARPTIRAASARSIPSYSACTVRERWPSCDWGRSMK